MNTFERFDYNPDNLALVLTNDFVSVRNVIKEKFHFRFLLDYLGNNEPDALAAKTIIVEKDYISRSYINDYSSYYSLCFNDAYKKKIKRVHFFNNSFTNEEFEKGIVDNNSNIINSETYLGYIVVKNLPSVIIGATLLKTYKNDSERFFITRDANISLFGKKLQIKSLIFQEQDKVVSACATTALWVAFYKTSTYFQTHLPTPSEITISAKNSYNFTGRLFPNKEGLDHFQIGNAIENVGLVFELRNNVKKLKDSSLVKSFIYSYCKLGIPVLLGIDIEGKGRHLITISGFKYNKNNCIKHHKSKISLVSNELELFYAHDDRIGPFSRLRIKESKKDKIIETAWWVDESGSKKHKADVVSIIVPLDKKIRITYEDIKINIEHFDYLFKRALPEYNLVWDIFLCSSNEYKNEVLSNDDLSGNFKRSIVFKQLPKYIWISRLLIKNTIVFELIHDSTDVSSGHFCIAINCYDKGLFNILQTELLDNEFKNHILTKLNPVYLKLLESLYNENSTESIT